MNLEMLQSLHIIFYIILAVAVLAGFLRGFKKSLFTLVTMVIFYVFFFLTLDAIVDKLWVTEMPWLGGVLGNNIDPSLANFVSFEGSLETFLQVFLGDSIAVDTTNQELMALGTSLGQFVLKIMYTILYFTVILVIYKLIMWIIRLIIARNREGTQKNRLFGALVGAFNGFLAIFITLIMLGGIVSVAKNAMTIMASLETETTTDPVSFVPRDEIYEVGHNLLSETETMSAATDDTQAVDDLNQIITQYENNIFVGIAEDITTTSRIDDETKVPLHIDLFDAVMSFEQDDQVIAIRYELGVLSEAGTVIMQSDFMDTNDIMDLTGTEIESVFTILSESKLITENAPLMIELAVEHYDVTLPVERSYLYNDINYETELPQVGEIIGSLFDILNNSGLIDGSGSVSDITVEPDDIRALFSSIPESDLTMIVIEGVGVPMIENSESGFLAMIEIPSDVAWEDEVVAIGELLAAIAEQDVTLDDISSGDIMTVLNAFSEINTDTLLGSRLLNETMINILSGEAGVSGVEFLSVPTDIDWYDEYDGETLTQAGELRLLMDAFKALVNDISDLDFETLSLEDVAAISETTIDKLTSSRIISATVSDVIVSSDLDGTTIIIPDNLLDGQGYIEESELNVLLKSVSMVLDGGTFDVATVLSMNETDIDTFLSSEIITATMGKLIADISSGITIPDEVKTTVLADSVATEVITKTEIKDLLLAAQVLDVTDFEGFSFDASILDRLENETQTALDDNKLDTLLASQIIHASVSDMLIDLDLTSDVLVVPKEHPDETLLLDETKSVPFIDDAEIKDVFQAIYTLDITNFDNIDLQNINSFASDMPVLVESSIIQATISDIMLNATASDLMIPDDTLIDTADVTYVKDAELEALVDGMTEIGLTDLQAVSMTPGDLFTADGTVVFASEIIQATVSEYILDVALREDDAYDGTSLIVPNQERLSITVGGTAEEMIRTNEIIAILDALETFGMTSSFTDDITSSAVTDMDEAQLSTILTSDSFHVTADAMINDSLIVPDFITGEVANVADVTSSAEIIDLIVATKRFSAGSDISDVSFDYATLSTMDEADADVILDSAIVRATLTPDIEALPATSPTAADYDDAAMTTLKETYIMGVLGY